MNYYYLYLIKFEDGRFYIGSRKSKVPAAEDVNYWGSPGKNNRPLWEMQKEKHILFESTNIPLKELREKEYEMIRSGWEKFGKGKCINKNAGGLDTIPEEVRKKVSKEVGEKSKELGLGIHSLTEEQHRENAKKGGKIVGNMMYEQGRGIFSLTKEQRKEISRSGGKIGGQKNKELKLGICGLSKEQRSENSKKLYELKIGIHGLPKEQRSQNSKKAYASGLSKLTKEQRSRNGKKGAKNASKVLVEKLSKEFELISPTGELIKEKNLRKFCRDNNLTRHSVNRVLRGEQKQHNGWTKP